VARDHLFSMCNGVYVLVEIRRRISLYLLLVSSWLASLLCSASSGRMEQCGFDGVD